MFGIGVLNVDMYKLFVYMVYNQCLEMKQQVWLGESM